MRSSNGRHYNFRGDNLPDYVLDWLWHHSLFCGNRSNLHREAQNAKVIRQGRIGQLVKDFCGSRNNQRWHEDQPVGNDFADEAGWYLWQSRNLVCDTFHIPVQQSVREYRYGTKRTRSPLLQIPAKYDTSCSQHPCVALPMKRKWLYYVQRYRLLFLISSLLGCGNRSS